MSQEIIHPEREKQIMGPVQGLLRRATEKSCRENETECQLVILNYLQLKISVQPATAQRIKVTIYVSDLLFSS